MSNPTHLVTGNTLHTRPENRVFYPALDGIRAVAFTMVFLQHYLHMPWGWTGVNIFFVLSGFLITGILVNTRDSPFRARNFYIRRTLRIFPLYYGIFLLLLLLTPIFRWQWSALWLAWPLYLGNFLRFLGPSTTTMFSVLEKAGDGFLRSSRFPGTDLFLGHFWSLCVEEQFYLIWPWAVFYIRSRKTLIWLCAAIIIGAPIARIVLQATAAPWLLHEELLYRCTPLQMDSLLLGGLLALLWRGSHRDQLLRFARLLAPAMLLLAVSYTLWNMRPFSSHSFMDYPYPHWMFTFGLCFVNFFSAAAILCCLQGGNLFSSVLGLRPLRWAGRISYGAYVYHDIPHAFYERAVIHFTRHHPLTHNQEQLIIAALGYVCTLVIAALSFSLFESRFLDLKDRLTTRAPDVQPAA